MKSTANLNFERIGFFPVSPDSLYSFLDDWAPGVTYKYFLLVVAKSGDTCYSDMRTIKINGNNAFTIYPNPSTGKMLVWLKGYLGHANFIVTNSTGQIILRKEITNSYNPNELDFTNQPKGIYFLKAETSDGTSVQKFLLQ